ncbi:MAG: hypothetical protein E4G94_00930 [ANME-2 cluster archaeon]|nr:MAG: hypothetical protein E4G94_00930 [ANME-2 cluster archaeon]
MDFWQIDKLTLFLIFFIPGFISIKIYDLLVPSERRDYSKSLFEIISYSAINFAALSWLIILIHSDNFYINHVIFYFFSIFFILFIAPILWPFFIIKLFSWKPIANLIVHPIQKPWDYVFGKRQPYWLIVHLKDGRKIGGKFDYKSFASSNPAEEQIYLEEVWKLDENGKFSEPVERTKGIIILSAEILSIEFFE